MLTPNPRPKTDLLTEVWSRNVAGLTGRRGDVHIGQPTINVDDDSALWRCKVESDSGPDELWFRVPAEHRHLLTGRGDAAVTALLIPAMHAGESVESDGPLSDLFAAQLPAVQSVVSEVIPTLDPVKVAGDTVPDGQPADGVATGFSAGIDSFQVLAQHRERLTHLLFNNVGAHGAGGQELFEARFRRVKQVAERVGLPLVKVDSNVDDFYRLGFQQTHTLRNAAVALLLQGGIGRWLYASTHDYRHVTVRPAGDMAYVDPVLLPLLSTGTATLASVGGEHTRLAKTMQVAGVPESWDALDVCVSSEVADVNCSRCWKCLRTLLTLESDGMLDRYEAVFDLDVYWRHRTRYLAQAAASRDPLVREVVDGVRLPLPVRAAALPVRRAIGRSIRSARQWTPGSVRRGVRRVRR